MNREEVTLLGFDCCPCWRCSFKTIEALKAAEVRF